ncbi:hypothetical protein DFH29DRAFT_878839 [Suillus ampliporus]|nr:hypothetical protein DFH29DRAFT_878839 [Suillus ampliporus]
MDVSALTPLLVGLQRCHLRHPTRALGRYMAMQFSSRVDEIEDVVTGSRIWKQRIDLGMVTGKEPLDYSFTVVILQDSGIPWDLIFVHPYDKYDELERIAMVTISIFEVCKVEEFHDNASQVGRRTT